MRLLTPTLLGATAMVVVAAAAAGTVDDRPTRTVAEIEFQYSPGQEALVEEIAPRLAAHNVRAARLTTEPSAAAPLPLSATDMRAKRSEYLARIASYLALPRLGPLQEECFDAFLDNYERHERLLGLMREGLERLTVIRKVTVWPRAELVRRLEAGETLAGFRWDAAAQSGQVDFGFEYHANDARLKELAEQRKDLQRQYQLAIATGEGGTTYRASFSPKGRNAPTLTSDNSADPDLKPAVRRTDAFPMVVPADLDGRSAADQAAALFDRPSGVSAMLQEVLAAPGKIPAADPALAFVVLHETIETAIVDHYLRSADRRWFCDGVANYVAWRVIRDLHGEAAAARSYDLAGQLLRHAAWRPKAELPRWRAVEHSSADELQSELELARYAFATEAVARMHILAGDDVLPKLFREMAKTKPQKATLRTVEAAWKRLTGKRLDVVLRAAER